MAGIDANKITPANPFEKSGGTAALLQAAVAEVDPAQAAKWRVAAGGGLSIATLAELESGSELSAAAKADLYAHDHQFVSDLQKQKAADAASTEKWLEEQAEAATLRNKTREMGGDERLAKERLKAEAQRDEELRAAREASAKHAQQLEKRLQQQRDQRDRMVRGLL